MGPFRQPSHGWRCTDTLAAHRRRAVAGGRPARVSRASRCRCRFCPSPPAAAPPAPVALEPGGRITVLDTLTADELEEGRILEPEPHERGTLPPPAAETSKGEPLPLRRYYVAYAFSPRGAPGPVGTVAEFVLHQLPPPPAVVGASYTPAGGAA